eukprot:g49170.t1
MLRVSTFRDERKQNFVFLNDLSSLRPKPAWQPSAALPSLVTRLAAALPVVAAAPVAAYRGRGGRVVRNQYRRRGVALDEGLPHLDLQRRTRLPVIAALGSNMYNALVLDDNRDSAAGETASVVAAAPKSKPQGNFLWFGVALALNFALSATHAIANIYIFRNSPAWYRSETNINANHVDRLEVAKHKDPEERGSMTGSMTGSSTNSKCSTACQKQINRNTAALSLS